MTKQLRLDLAHDTLERFSGGKPIRAVEELIWNSLDADADRVRVKTTTNQMNGLSKLIVEDNGLGIDYSDVERAFGKFGGSTKRLKRKTAKGRVPHGQFGRGRFRAFAIGSKATWQSVFEDDDGNVMQFEIVARKGFLESEVSEPKDTDKPTGTKVILENPESGHLGLLDEEVIADELAGRFALYMKQYPGIDLRYGSLDVDPQTLQSRIDESQIELELDGDAVEAFVTVIEWNKNVPRAIHFCDKAGHSLHDLPPSIKAPGFQFTAYVTCDKFDELEKQGAFAAEKLDPAVGPAVDAVKEHLRTHFRNRQAENASDLVDRWKATKVYPYEGEPGGLVETAERQVFDICAATVHDYLPKFDSTDERQQKLTFRLLREALESGPSELGRILEQVLELSEEEQVKLDRVLQRTKLSSVIEMAATVADRLDFLKSLRTLIFEEPSKRLKERSQLQRILVGELWLFGEQYELGADDESLTNVLKHHLTKLGRDQIAEEIEEKVLRTDGRDAIVDLMLHKREKRRAKGPMHHLVVELKRPTCKIGTNEINQIESYAFAVQEDGRFDKRSTDWTFIVVGKELTADAERKCQQSDRAFGHIHTGQGIDVYVIPWSRILDDAEARHEHLRDQLAISVSDESGWEYLDRKHSDHIIGVKP